ncbi:MAG: hypothetical protein U0350_11725 [Caldilineaceae bacterium]
MLGVRGIVVGLVSAALMLGVAACGPAPINSVQASSNSQALVTAPGTAPSPQADDVVWGKVPYCNCLATSATANVANALKQANLTVRLQELSPHEGWLYFTVTFDPRAATANQVGAAMVAGGAKVLQGPP